MQLVQINDTNAYRRRLTFYLVSTDGRSPYTGGTGIQPQVSINQSAFSSTGIGTLVHVGLGYYYAEVDVSLIASACLISGIVSDSACITTPSLNQVQVVAWNPYGAVSSHSVTDIWSAGTRDLTALGTGVVASIWAYAAASASTAGSLGKRISDYMDAAISSRSSFDSTTSTVKLSSDGLDSISLTPAVGRPTNFREWMAWLFRRFGGRTESNAGVITVKDFDDSTLLTTQTLTATGSDIVRSKVS